MQLTVGAAGFGTLYWAFYGKENQESREPKQALGRLARREKDPVDQWAALERERQETSGRVWGISRRKQD